MSTKIQNSTGLKIVTEGGATFDVIGIVEMWCGSDNNTIYECDGQIFPGCIVAEIYHPTASKLQGVKA